MLMSATTLPVLALREDSVKRENELVSNVHLILKHFIYCSFS